MKSGYGTRKAGRSIVFKWLGAGILMLSAWLTGTGLIREHQNRLRELEALYDMISCIRDNIEHLMKPLPEIFRIYTNPYLETCGFLAEAKKNGLRRAWENHTTSVSGEAGQLIEEFTRNIGNGYRTEELRLCEYTLDRLRKILDHTRTETANQRKLYRSVPMLFALSVILILL